MIQVKIVQSIIFFPLRLSYAVQMDETCNNMLYVKTFKKIFLGD